MLDGARTKVRNGLATSSFFLALSGGILGSVSLLGGWIRNITDIGPWWTAPAAWAVLFVICLGDWAEDAIPNRPAVYTAIIWPSLLVGTLTGKSGAKLFRAIGVISKPTAKKWESGVSDWTRLPSDQRAAFTIFSLILVVAAITHAQRYAKKTKRAAAATAAGTPATATARGRTNR